MKNNIEMIYVNERMIPWYLEEMGYGFGSYQYL